jgi:hypothetical protein
MLKVGTSLASIAAAGSLSRTPRRRAATREKAAAASISEDAGSATVEWSQRGAARVP